MKNYQFYTFAKSALVMLILLIFGSQSSIAQIQAVVSNTELIGKIQRKGLKTTIAFGEKEVAQAWKEYLKTFGKVSSKKDQYTMTSAKIPKISNKPLRLISKVNKESDNSTSVFCVFDMGAGYITREDERYTLAEGFMRDFSLKMHRDKYSEQIEDAEKIFSNAQDTEKKLIEKDEEMAKEIQKAREDIVDMENKILERRAKIIDLERQMLENRTSKRRAAEEVEQNRILVEQMKVKLGQIN